MALNPYTNLLVKVKALLKADDALTKDQCSQFQWQLLAKVPDCDFSFIIGKGGINTIFYMASTDNRTVCYPDEALEILTNLCKRKVFCYAAYDKGKTLVSHFLNEEDALKCEGAKYIRAVSFSGKTKLLWKKDKNLFGKNKWAQVGEIKPE